MYRDPEAASPGKRGPARRLGRPASAGRTAAARAPSRSPSPGACRRPGAARTAPRGHRSTRGTRVRTAVAQTSALRPLQVARSLPGPASQCPRKDLPPSTRQRKDNVCAGASRRCPRGSRTVPWGASLGSPAPEPWVGMSAPGDHPHHLPRAASDHKCGRWGAGWHRRCRPRTSGNLVQQPGPGGSGAGTAGGAGAYSPRRGEGQAKNPKLTRVLAQGERPEPPSFVAPALGSGLRAPRRRALLPARAREPFLPREIALPFISSLAAASSHTAHL